MKILDRLFSKNKKQQGLEDILSVSRIVRPLIDEVSKEICATYVSEFLVEPITYIVPAVWGVNNGSELTDSQKEMNRMIAPLITGAINQFGFRELTTSQEFAIGYLMRELIISKVIYMVSLLKSPSEIEYEFENIPKDMLN